MDFRQPFDGRMVHADRETIQAIVDASDHAKSRAAHPQIVMRGYLDALADSWVFRGPAGFRGHGLVFLFADGGGCDACNMDRVYNAVKR